MPHPTKFVTGGGISALFGEPGDGINGLGAYSKTTRHRVPDEYVPITYCNAQDILLLKFDTPRDFCGVWYLDSAAIDDDPRMYWVADTFNDFLQMLKLDSEEFEPPTETISIFQAIEQNNRRAVQTFLSAGEAVEARNERGWTLLACAAHYGYPRIVKLLLEHAADPNARDIEGKTPLHHAAQVSLDCVKLLLAAGGDIKARDNEGHGVIGNWYYRADKYLRDHGAEE